MQCYLDFIGCNSVSPVVLMMFLIILHKAKGNLGHALHSVVMSLTLQPGAFPLSLCSWTWIIVKTMGSYFGLCVVFPRDCLQILPFWPEHRELMLNFWPSYREARDLPLSHWG